MRERLRILRAVVASPALRRVEAAFIAFSVGEWATWVAVVVYAYARGGTAEAGVVAFVQLVPSIVIAPIASGLGDRFPRARVLAATYLAQGLAMAATALALAFEGPSLLVYALATVTATTITLTRPAQYSLLPDVVDTPDQLTAANVASATVEGSGSLIGPVLAGILVGIGGPGLVFAVTSAGLFFAAGAVVSVRPRSGIVGSAKGDEEAPIAVADVLGGVRAIAADARLLAILGVLACSMFLAGALDIFYAVLAIDLLALGESGVGYLGAAGGAGALAGAGVALSLVGRRAIGRPLLAAAIAAGVAIAVIGVAPVLVVAVPMLVVAAIGGQVIYVGTQTLVQRIAPPDALGRVFGVVEGLSMAAQALGALAVPAIAAVAGSAGAFVVAGLALPAVVLAGARALLAADRLAPEVAREIGLLRGIPMFALLSPPVVEWLAANVERVSIPAGTRIIRQGDRGDRYYVIASGRVRVEIDGRVIHDQHAGEGFGEIALLRDVPRTATVTAVDDVELHSLARAPFLAALTGHAASRAAADGLVVERLSAAP